jgi:hypothetical protein
LVNKETIIALEREEEAFRAKYADYEASSSDEKFALPIPCAWSKRIKALATGEAVAKQDPEALAHLLECKACNALFEILHEKQSKKPVAIPFTAFAAKGAAPPPSPFILTGKNGRVTVYKLNKPLKLNSDLGELPLAMGLDDSTTKHFEMPFSIGVSLGINYNAAKDQCIVWTEPIDLPFELKALTGNIVKTHCRYKPGKTPRLTFNPGDADTISIKFNNPVQLDIDLE